MNPMTCKSIILALALLVIQVGTPRQGDIQAEEKSAPSMKGDQNSELRCTIAASDTRWRVRGSTKQVSIEVDIHGSAESPVMPSLGLVAAPKGGSHQNEYWAPFSLANGTTSKEWQNLGPTTRSDHRSVRLFPLRLLWAPTKSSAWPSEAIAGVVPLGTYDVLARIETKDHAASLSNRVRITVVR